MRDVDEEAWSECDGSEGDTPGPLALAFMLRKLSRAPIDSMLICWAVTRSPLVVRALSHFAERGTLTRLHIGQKDAEGIVEYIPDFSVSELMRTVASMPNLTALTLFGQAQDMETPLPFLDSVALALTSPSARHKLQDLSVTVDTRGLEFEGPDLWTEGYKSIWEVLSIPTLSVFSIKSMIFLVDDPHSVALRSALRARAAHSGSVPLNTLRLCFCGDVGQTDVWHPEVSEFLRVLGDSNHSRCSISPPVHPSWVTPALPCALGCATTPSSSASTSPPPATTTDFSMSSALTLGLAPATLSKRSAPAGSLSPVSTSISNSLGMRPPLLPPPPAFFLSRYKSQLRRSRVAAFFSACVGSSEVARENDNRQNRKR